MVDGIREIAMPHKKAQAPPHEDCTCNNVRIMGCPASEVKSRFEGRAVMRRRRCPQCDRWFSTIEMPVVRDENGFTFSLPGTDAAAFFDAVASRMEAMAAQMRQISGSKGKPYIHNKKKVKFACGHIPYEADLDIFSGRGD